MSRKKRLGWESQDTESSKHRRLPVGPDARAGLGGERRKGGKQEEWLGDAAILNLRRPPIHPVPWYVPVQAPKVTSTRGGAVHYLYTDYAPRPVR
jgi:hypothetical protein